MELNIYGKSTFDHSNNGFGCFKLLFSCLAKSLLFFKLKLRNAN